MNNYQIARQASYKLIDKEAKNSPEAMSLIPKFAAGINRLGVISTQIDTLSIEQAKNITGIASDKNAQMDTVSDYLVEVSGAIHSYAVTKNDLILMAKVDYKESAISRMSQTDLIAATAIVLEEVGKIAPEELAVEGISATEITEFGHVFAQFKLVTSDTRGAIIDRSGYTQQLADLFAEAADLKKNTLDRLAPQFRRKDPVFYQKYKAAATVIYHRSPKTPTVTA